MSRISAGWRTTWPSRNQFNHATRIELRGGDFERHRSGVACLPGEAETVNGNTVRPSLKCSWLPLKNGCPRVLYRSAVRVAHVDPQEIVDVLSLRQDQPLLRMRWAKRSQQLGFGKIEVTRRWNAAGRHIK